MLRLWSDSLPLPLCSASQIMDHTGKEAEAVGVLVSCPRGSCRTGRPAGRRVYARPTVPGRGGEEASSDPVPGWACCLPAYPSERCLILETGSTASLVPLSSFRDPPPRRLVGKGGPSFDLFLFLSSGCFCTLCWGNRRVFPTLGIGEASGLWARVGWRLPAASQLRAPAAVVTSCGYCLVGFSRTSG